MEKSKFKTTIKCAGCVAIVTPFLDEAVGRNNWEVDYNHPLKVLTVSGENDTEKIVKAVQNAGFKAEAVNG